MTSYDFGRLGALVGLEPAAEGSSVVPVPSGGWEEAGAVVPLLGAPKSRSRSMSRVGRLPDSALRSFSLLEDFAFGGGFFGASSSELSSSSSSSSSSSEPKNMAEIYT